MSIRVRIVNGQVVALCAVESDPMPDDLYLDDSVHAALASKFAYDWQGETVTWGDDSGAFALMDTQKVRDAQEECFRWASEQIGVVP